MVATVHDEINFVVREEYVWEATNAIKKCFETAVDFCVPILADVKSGDTYADTK